MSENIENLVLEHLRALRNEVAGLRTEMHEEFREVKLRLGSVETAVVAVRRDSADQMGDVVRQQLRIDQLAERLDRLERRMELAG
jgi:tetrahydromethanopterin S-methyltransferase subunit G